MGERYVLLFDVLPERGDFTTLKIVNDLRMQLAPSEKDIKEFEIKTEGNSVKWNTKGIDTYKEIEIGEKGEDIIISRLKEINDKKELSGKHYSLYEKFVEGKW